MAIKPTHAKAVAEMLTSDEYATPLDMAKAVLIRYNELRSADVNYVIVTQYDTQGDPFYIGMDGFATRAQAGKMIEAGRAGIPGYGRRAIVPAYSRQHVEERFASINDVPADPWLAIREEVA